MSYLGAPSIPNLTGITVHITVSRASGFDPCDVQVCLSDTRATFSDGGAAFEALYGRKFCAFTDLDHEINFGAPGVRTLKDAHNADYDANVQQGGAGGFIYDTPGTYTITATSRGKLPNGTFVTASSTTLNVNCLQTIEFRHPANFQARPYGPTGGVFRLSLDSGSTWTGYISWQASPCGGPEDTINRGTGTLEDPYNSIEYALEAAYGFGNFIVVGMPRRPIEPVVVEFRGPYRGASQPLIQVDNLLTGPTVEPVVVSVRQSQAGSQSASVNVTAWSGDVKYWDTTAPSGGDGTIGSPYNQFSIPTLDTYMRGGNWRRAMVKRGSDLTVYGSLSLGDQGTGHQLLDYGSGPLPIIRHQGTNDFISHNLKGSLNTPNDAIGFIHVRGIHLVCGSSTRSFFNGNNVVSLPSMNYYANTLKHVCFDNIFCDTVGTGYRFEWSFGSTGYGFTMWGLDDTNPHPTSGLIASHGAMARWAQIVGCKFTETAVGAVNIRVHHCYIENKNYTHIRSCRSGGMSVRNMFLNMDTITRKNQGGGSRYCLVADVDLSNSRNGIEFSNDTNYRSSNFLDESGGKFFYTAILKCRGACPLGFQVYAVTHGPAMVVSGCEFWNSAAGHVGGGEQAGTFDAWGNKLYQSINAKFHEVKSDRGTFIGNIVQSDVKITAGGNRMSYASEGPGWKYQNNQYYVPPAALHASGEAEIWNNSDTGAYEGFSAWSARAWASGETFSDPGWTDPFNGDFSTGTPPPITYTPGGPATGTVGQPIVVTLTPSRLSSETITVEATGVAATVSPSALVWAASSTTLSASVTPSAEGTMTVTFRRAGSSVASIAISVGSGAASVTYSFSGATSSVVGQPVTLTITPSGASTDTLTYSVSGVASTSVPTTHTWSDALAKTLVVTGSAVGNIVVTASRSGVAVATRTIVVSAGGSSVLYTPSGPTSAVVGQPFTLSLTPSVASSETIAVELSGPSASATPTSLVWSNDTSTKTVEVTPNNPGVLVVAFTRGGEEVARRTVNVSAAFSGSGGLPSAMLRRLSRLNRPRFQ